MEGDMPSVCRCVYECEMSRGVSVEERERDFFLPIDEWQRRD